MPTKKPRKAGAKPAPKKGGEPAGRKPAAKPSRKSSRKPLKPVPVESFANREGYGSFRDSQAAVSRARSATGREIGAIPDIADVERREGCRLSLRLFCEVYNPAPLYFGWSDDHLTAIARIEEAATRGALFAFAMPRGSGKTLLCRMAALWAVSYAHRRYPFVIGATDEKARETLDTLRILIRFLPEYAADFPEISWPAICLQGIANRASGQTCEGQSTLIEWAADRIVLPTVPPPSNWSNAWELRADGMVPTSGVLVSASGLTGEGIRGSLKTLTTGEMVRPDFVLLDDPQTTESAGSRAQNEKRLQLVSADVLGMAGPGKAIAAVMPCTVIERGDMVDEVLDRGKHPLWRGERSGILRSLPDNLGAWDDYFEVYARCAQREPPDFEESNAYYRKHRAALEAGAVASWPDRMGPDEASAVQSAMHLYFRNRRVFMAEYMNDPESRNPAASNALNPDEIAAKVAGNVARGTVPRSCTRLTAFIDVGGDLIWYLVAAWDERFGGCVIDYGTCPDQSRDYFAKNDARPALGDLPAVKGQSQDAAVHAGLTAAAERVLGRTYLQEETGVPMSVEFCPVDANWGPATDLVYGFVRQSPYRARLIASHGKFIGASSSPMGSWQKRAGERTGPGWRLSHASTHRGRHVTIDVNQWKTFVGERLRTPPGGAGCLSLFDPETGKTGRSHRMVADHFAAEYPVEVTMKASDRTVQEWKLTPGRDNDWWDAAVGAAVAASIQGLVWSPSGQLEPSRVVRPKLKLSEIQARKRAAAGAT